MALDAYVSFVRPLMDMLVTLIIFFTFVNLLQHHSFPDTVYMNVVFTVKFVVR